MDAGGPKRDARASSSDDDDVDTDTDEASAQDDEGTDSDDEGTDSDDEGTDSDDESTDSDDEGTNSDDESTDSDDEGTDSDDEGTDSDDAGTSEDDEDAGDEGDEPEELPPCPSGYMCQDSLEQIRMFSAEATVTDGDGNQIMFACSKGQEPCADPSDPEGSCPNLPNAFCAKVEIPGVYEGHNCAQLCSP